MKRYANVKSVLWTLATLPKCVELILNISLSSALMRKTENAKKKISSNDPFVDH